VAIALTRTDIAPRVAVAQAKPRVKEDARVDSDPFYASFPMH
jgi:hypothetical protein